MTKVEYSNTGWLRDGTDRPGACPVLPRLNAGLPVCTNTAVFRITDKRRHYVSTSYCCWECMPVETDDVPFYEAAGV